MSRGRTNVATGIIYGFQQALINEELSPNVRRLIKAAIPELRYGEPIEAIVDGYDRHCPQCGGELDGYGDFCNHCGQWVE